MQYHILNGDALKKGFPIELIGGEVIVIREAFIEGPVSDQYGSAFWLSRKNYIEKAYGESDTTYDKNVMSELNRLQQISVSDVVYLWFEDDLFCQCNMWFVVNYILHSSHPVFYRVFPEADDVTWMGFGRADRETLFQYYNQAIKLNQDDVSHIDKLWKALVANDRKKLEELSHVECTGIRFQEEVIHAQLDLATDGSNPGRPQHTLSKLMNDGPHSFYELYAKFIQTEGIYGFGDSQVRNMLKVMNINL